MSDAFYNALCDHQHIEGYEEGYKDGYEAGKRDAISPWHRVEDELPESNDAVPVVHGYWVTKTVRGDYVPCCSECGCGNGTLYEYDYCPNCGARMDKSEPPKEEA